MSNIIYLLLERLVLKVGIKVLLLNVYDLGTSNIFSQKYI